MDEYKGEISIVFDKSDLAGVALQTQVGGAIAKCALTVEALAKIAIMTGPKTGKVYKRKSVEHQASAPGQAPANDLGDLVQSILANVEDAGDDLEAEVVAGSDHAIFLEFGTVNIAPRPFLEPAAEVASLELNSDLAKIRLITD
jgi:hypothetical protein